VLLRTSRRPQPPQFDPIEKPISVFLSSAREEFEQIRHSLKDDIDDIGLKLAKPFNTILVEERRGVSIDHDIEEGQTESDVHIVLIGANYSEVTRDEFLKAWRMGLKTYVYIFLKRRAIHPKSKRNANYSFVHNEIKPRCRIRGYDKPYRIYEKLLDDVSADLASFVVDMVHESARIRKIIGR
jgi:hypothetical protein